MKTLEMAFEDIQVIGHRGAPILAPENTWESFDRALAAGADGIETDVRRTRDGQIILMHDTTLNRTTNGAGLVSRADFNAIKRLDAGCWFGEAFRGAKIPVLGETLDRYALRTQMVIQIKEAEIAIPVLEEVLARHVLPNVTFTSLHVDALRNIRRHTPAARTGLLVSAFSNAKIVMTHAEGFTQICPPAAQLTAKNINRARQLGLEIRTWQVTNDELMHDAIRCCVDGMTVDNPLRLLAALGRPSRSLLVGTS